MKIVIFTSDQRRHIYFINKLSRITNNLHCFIDPKKKSKIKNKVTKNYFSKVNISEKKFFKDRSINKNVFIKNFDTLKNNMDTLPKDKKTIFIVFGCGLIKGKLFNFLKKKNCLNLHAGISPFYRGVACNPWAILDHNIDKVGCSILYLDRKIDGGKIIFYSKPMTNKKNIFDLSMYALKCGIDDLVLKIKKKKILNIKPIKQDYKKLIRLTKSKDFNLIQQKKFIEMAKLKL